MDRKKAKDLKVLADFIGVYCREHHREETKAPFAVKDERLLRVLGDRNLELCHDCSRLLNHGTAKLLLCPYDPKPACRKCETHCYAPGYREKIRQVMRFSGPYMVKRGRLDMMLHYLK
ncbi:MAG: nitrous oxide-stimulated promoter family protein [Dehalococcoidia bacterium]|nr:MAG: nitrous oxide-stimulated promoter family protein [Dehalococcoidia bacterium]